MGEDREVVKHPFQGIYYKGKIYEELEEFLKEVEFDKNYTI